MIIKIKNKEEIKSSYQYIDSHEENTFFIEADDFQILFEYKDQEELKDFVISLSTLMLDKDVEYYKNIIKELIDKLEEKYKYDLDYLKQDKMVEGLNLEKLKKAKKNLKKLDLVA